MTASVLFVCLGNICRSPTAEAVCRTLAAGDGQDILFDSAGTGDWHVGDPPDFRARKTAGRQGYEMAALRARTVTSDDFDRFDLILAMDSSNLRWLERRRPSGSRAQLGLFLEFALGPSHGDVPDPYYSGQFDMVLELIERAGAAIVAKLRKHDGRRAHGPGP